MFTSSAFVINNTVAYAQSLTAMLWDSCNAVGSSGRKTPFGGLLFDICSTEPPLLQIRIFLEELEPGATLPKSIMRLPPGSQPPSAVLIEKFATGAVEAEPSRIIEAFPPVVQVVKKD